MERQRGKGQRTQYLELVLHRSGILDVRQYKRVKNDDEDELDEETMRTIAAIKHMGQLECKRNLLLCSVAFPLILIIIFLLGLLLASRQ